MIRWLIRGFVLVVGRVALPIISLERLGGRV